MSQKPIDIIIPTYHGAKVSCDVTHEPMLVSTMKSLMWCSEYHPIRLIIVDNGDQMIEAKDENVIVVKMRRNMGWERGLIEGLKVSDSEIVIFCNDDVFVPPMSRWWIRDFAVQMRSDKQIAQIGPASNVVAGPQNIWFQGPNKMEVAWLIGFCVMVRRSALDAIGGVDDTLPGGDDLDLGLRFNRAGYKVIADRSHFIYHHGFKTGNVVHGDHTKEGGWNSPQMTERTNAALLAKHGEAAFKMLWEVPKPYSQTTAGSVTAK